MFEEGRVDQRRIERIGASQLDRPTAFRPQQAHVTGKTVAEPYLPSVIADGTDDEVHLDVRSFQIGTRLQECAAFGKVGGQGTGSRVPVLPDVAQRLDRAAYRYAERIQAVRLVAENEVRVILQVLSHAREIGDDLDSVTSEFVLRPDAGQHQQLRRLKRAGGKDHLLLRPDRLDIPATRDFDANGPLAVEHDAPDLRARLHRQVAARLHVRKKIRTGRTPALAILLGHW